MKHACCISLLLSERPTPAKNVTNILFLLMLSHSLAGYKTNHIYY